MNTNKFHRPFLISLLALMSFLASAQVPNQTRQQVVDSLTELLLGTKGTARVDVLNALASELAPRSFDSSLIYVEAAFRLAEELNYTYGKGVATFNRGNCYFFKSDYKNSLINYLAALHILEPFQSTLDMANLYYQLAMLNQYVRNTKKTNEYYRRASTCFLAIGDTVQAMFSLHSIGDAYLYKYQTMRQIEPLPETMVNAMMDSALKYNQVVLEWADLHPKPSRLMLILNSRGMYYSTKEDPDALASLNKAFEYAQMIADSSSRIVCMGLMSLNLGSYYFEKLYNAKKGYDFLNSAAGYLRQTDRDDFLSAIFMDLGRIDLSEGRYESAEKNLLAAVDRVDTFLFKLGSINFSDPTARIFGITQTRSWRLGCLEHLVRLYEQTGNFKKALEYHKKYEEEKSSQVLDGLNREMMGLQAEYDDQVKRQQILGLSRDNELRRMKLNQARILFTGIGGLALIILLILMLWIQRRRSRSEKKALILEQKLLRSQMNPHFIFNSLSSIQNFIVTEKPDKASIYLSKFSKLVRHILDNSREEFVSLEKEIGTIENYLELQKVRYAGKFDYRIDITDDIDPETMQIPPMLAQPFIENAIEHGIKHRETPGHIKIRFSLKDHTLIFEVEDDGVGREKAREIELMRDPEHKSMATSLTRERLVNLNRKLHRKIELEIIDLQNALGEAAGTRVVFGVPV